MDPKVMKRMCFDIILLSFAPPKSIVSNIRNHNNWQCCRETRPLCDNHQSIIVPPLNFRFCTTKGIDKRKIHGSPTALMGDSKWSSSKSSRAGTSFSIPFSHLANTNVGVAKIPKHDQFCKQPSRHQGFQGSFRSCATRGIHKSKTPLKSSCFGECHKMMIEFGVPPWSHT